MRIWCQNWVFILKFSRLLQFLYGDGRLNFFVYNNNKIYQIGFLSHATPIVTKSSSYTDFLIEKITYPMHRIG